MAGDVAKRHCGQLREHLRSRHHAAEELAIDRGSRRLHGDGGGKREGSADRLNRAEHCGGYADRRGNDVGARCSVKDQEGKGIEARVHDCHTAAQPGTDDGTDNDPDDGDDQHELDIVRRHRRAAVAERLEEADLFALERDHAREGHVYEKRRHQQEDRREDPRHALQLRQLAVEESV